MKSTPLIQNLNNSTCENCQEYSSNQCVILDCLNCNCVAQNAESSTNLTGVDFNIDGTNYTYNFPSPILAPNLTVSDLHIALSEVSSDNNLSFFFEVLDVSYNLDTEEIISNISVTDLTTFDYNFIGTGITNTNTTSESEISVEALKVTRVCSEGTECNYYSNCTDVTDSYIRPCEGCENNNFVKICEQALRTYNKCLSPDTSGIIEQTFIGDAASGAGAFTTWQSALGGQPVVLDIPSPNGSTTIYNGTDYNAEHVGFLTGTALSSLPRYSMTIETPAAQGGASASFAGFDGNGSNSNPNAILFSFNSPIGAMSFTALDLESETVNAQVLLYDASETLLQTIPVVYTGGETGGGEAHNIGFTRVSNDVSYVMVVVGATVAMPNQNNNRLAIGDIRYSTYQEIETIVVDVLNADGTISCLVFDAETKQPVDIDPNLLNDCTESIDEEDCGSFTGNCMCYGGDGTSSDDYVYINPDNNTDISFSQNTTTIKWSIDLGQDTQADGTGGFIQDCINNSGVATMTITDAEGNVVIFNADAVLQDGTATGGWAFTGTSAGGFSGKVREVRISCSSSNPLNSGKACQWISCDKTVEKWFDGTRELTQDEIDTLEECTIPVTIEPPCEISILQVQGCAAEDVVGQATIGDLILTVAKQDCEGVILESTQYNITTGNTELTEPVNTTDCSPEPDVVQTEECIIDTGAVKWTEVTIVQGISVTVIYINQDTLSIGTPQGSPSEWSSCVEGAFDIEEKEVCVEAIELDGQVWVLGEVCNSGNVYYSTSTDQAILDEQTIVGGWAIVVASAIQNCAVEGAAVIGSPSTDPTTLPIIQCTINQHTVYDVSTGNIEYVYYTDLSNNNIIQNSIPVKCNCCPEVKEHYVCINGIKVPVWVSLNPSTLGIIRVLNTVDLSIVDPTIYENGFVDPCAECCDTTLVTCAMFRQDYYDLADFIGDGDFPLTWELTGTDACGLPINISVSTPLDAGWTDNTNIYDDLISALSSIDGVQATPVNTLGYNGDNAPEIEISIAANVSITINRTHIAENDMFTISESGGTTTVTATDTGGTIGSPIWHECGTAVEIGNNNTFPNTL